MALFEPYRVFQRLYYVTPATMNQAQRSALAWERNEPQELHLMVTSGSPKGKLTVQRQLRPGRGFGAIGTQTPDRGILSFPERRLSGSNRGKV